MGPCCLPFGSVRQQFMFPKSGAQMSPETETERRGNAEQSRRLAGKSFVCYFFITCINWKSLYIFKQSVLNFL